MAESIRFLQGTTETQLNWLLPTSVEQLISHLCSNFQMAQQRLLGTRPRPSNIFSSQIFILGIYFGGNSGSGFGLRARFLVQMCTLPVNEYLVQYINYL